MLLLALVVMAIGFAGQLWLSRGEPAAAVVKIMCLDLLKFALQIDRTHLVSDLHSVDDLVRLPVFHA